MYDLGAVNFFFLLCQEEQAVLLIIDPSLQSPDPF